MEVRDSTQGNVILWNVTTTSSDQIHNMMNIVSRMEKSKMDMIEEQLFQTYNIYIETRKKYEEELKKTYILEQRVPTLENEVRNLRNATRPIIEVKNQDTQTDVDTINMGMDQPMEVDELEVGKEVEVKTMDITLSHKINILKQAFQNHHSRYITLQGVEYQCAKALFILSQLFTKWGPYIPFFDSLVPIIAQKKEFPKETIISTRKMVNKVKDSNAFFSGKQIINNKMKNVANGAL